MTTPERRIGATAVAIAVSSIAVAACGDPRPPIDSSEARAVIDDAIARYDDGTGDGSIDVDECVVGDAAPLIDQSFSLVDDDIVEGALGGSEYARYTTSGDQRWFACGRSAAAGSVGLAVGPAPDTVESYVRSLGELVGGAPTDSVVDRADERGGAMRHVCAIGETPRDVCEVTWTDGTVLVSAFVVGAGAGDVDLGQVEERFRQLIQLVVDGVASG